MERAGKASMSSESQGVSSKLSVVVSFGEARAEFSGTPEAVIQSVNSFVAKNVPEIDLARRVSLNHSSKELVDKFKDFVKITPEGPRVWTQESKLSDKDVVALQLVAQRIASETREGVQSSMTLAALQEATSLNPKSLSSRLSELTKAGHVVRETKDGTTTFRISTIGVEWLSDSLSKKA